jgi:hypothetical protein
MRWRIVAAAVAVVAMVSPAFAANGVPHSSGGAPLPAAPGLGLRHNADAEPGVAVAPDGAVWVASSVSPNPSDDPRARVSVFTGSDVWRSTDRGRHFGWVASPFSTLALENPGLGGGDTDVAVAPVRNSAGHYQVYVASLWLGATNVATSADDGRTWTAYQVSGLPAQDRPWLAASGPCTFYLSYESGFEQPAVSTFDGCVPPNAGYAPTLDPTSTALLGQAGTGGDFNKPAVDASGRVYQPVATCGDSGAGVVTAVAVSCTSTVFLLATSDNGARTFTEHVVARSPRVALPLWGPTVAAGSGGAVYYAWEDAGAAYVVVSRDGGSHWSAPVRVSGGTDRTVVYPTHAAGASGRVALAYYATDRAGDPSDRAVMGAPGSGASWYVVLATSDDAGRTWRRARMTAPVHRGVVCQRGLSCAGDGDRDLFEDFGVGMDARTGLSTIAYSADLPGGLPASEYTGFVTERCRLGTPTCRP